MVRATRTQSLEPLIIVIERLVISLLNVPYSLLQGVRLLGGKVLVEEGLVQFGPSVYCSRWQKIIPGSGGFLQRETKSSHFDLFFCNIGGLGSHANIMELAQMHDWIFPSQSMELREQVDDA